MDTMQNIKGTKIVALAIPKLCTVIDFYVSCQEGVPPVLLSPSLQDSERYDMLQRESFVLQQYPEKRIQWTDAGNPLSLDVGSHLLHGPMEQICLSRHEQNKYASEAPFL